MLEGKSPTGCCEVKGHVKHWKLEGKSPKKFVK